MANRRQNMQATPEMQLWHLMLGAAGRPSFLVTPAITAQGVCPALPRLYA